MKKKPAAKVQPAAKPEAGALPESKPKPKREPKPKPEPRGPQHAPLKAADYSEELVVNTAARLLVQNDYQDAAKRAIALIASCRGEIAKQRRMEEVMLGARNRAMDMDARTLVVGGKPYIMRWRDLLTYITGEKREGRGQTKLKSYWSHCLRYNESIRSEKAYEDKPEPDEKEITSFIEELKAEGMSSQWALGHKDKFAAWWKDTHPQAKGGPAAPAGASEESA